MKFKNFTFLLLCVSITFPSTQQFISNEFIIDNALVPMKIENFLFTSLNFLQQKITQGTFTNRDMLKLFVLKEIIHQMEESRNQRRRKEQTVYWLSRQGR